KSPCTLAAGPLPKGGGSHHLGDGRLHTEILPMKKYVIEREIPGVGQMNAGDYVGVAKTSNAALSKLAPKVQWQHSYIAKDKTFCIYLAETEDDIREHARLSGFPANKITEILTVIDPATDRG